MRDSESLPVLSEDDTRFDWRDAAYDAEVRVEPTRATVVHQLRGATTLERLLDQGHAGWATELRSPKTLYCRVVAGPEDRQTVKWDPEDVDGEMFVIPGLLALREIALTPHPGEMAPIWGDAPIRIPSGWWLARGSARRTRTLGQSLLKFTLDKKLPNGRMRIQPDLSEEDLQFHVRLAEDIWPEHLVRHVQMAALIGALGQLGVLYRASDNGSEEPRIVAEIRQRLERAGVPTWDDPTTWDPAGAATVIEPFHRTEASAPADDE